MDLAQGNVNESISGDIQLMEDDVLVRIPDMDAATATAAG